MSTDATINLDFAESQLLSTVSMGPDGDAFVVDDGRGSRSELRVLCRAAADQIIAIEKQLSLIPLVNHRGVRGTVNHQTQSNAAEFKLELDADVDPQADRLTDRLDRLKPVERMQVAASIVDTVAAAHRVGLFHGTMDASTILLVEQSGRLVPRIDFSGMRCSPNLAEPIRAVEADLSHLLSLLRRVVSSVVESPGDTAVEGFSGRKRAILRQWLRQSDNDSAPPSIDQWQSILDVFLPPQADAVAMNMDQTSIVQAARLPTGPGSSSPSVLLEQRLYDQPNIPEQLGRFMIGGKIGEGGMGTVYHGTDLASGEAVAVKVLRNTRKDIAQSIRRFHKEARVLAAVQNDHVTRLIDVGEDGGVHFIAMEFVPGIDLKTWLAGRKGLPEDEALQLTADLARSLVDAHAAEVIHRDIKPENVLLKWNGDGDKLSDLTGQPITSFTLKLTDFGIARHIKQSESMEMTKAGSVMGTPKYMSPEQCKSSSELAPTTDVYSIGITMFELLTGAVPFDADDFMELATMHCFDPVPSPQKRDAKISDAADRIVKRALAKSPEDRFGDASQMLAELLRLLRGDSEGMDAHPKLPEQHQVGKVWEKTVQWNLESDAADLWPLVSNTERLNEALGFPEVEYRIEKDPVKGVRKFGAFTLSGLKISWEEHPFEWVEGQRMGILREFDSGPFKWFLSVVTLQPTSGGGTTLSHQVRIEPRNFFGRVMTTIEADWKGFRRLDKVYRRLDRSIQGRLVPRDGTDPFSPGQPIGRVQRARLENRIERIVDAGVDAETADKLRHCIEDWSAQDLAAIRPLAMADRQGASGPAMIDACLIAAHEGILSLRWDILCPTCRVSASSSGLLSEIDAHTHCEACDVDFQSNLSSSIEMVFQVHPEIRDANFGKYCIGGPKHSPHVVAQVRVDAGECLELALDLGVGDYLIRGPQLPRTQTIRVQSSAAPSIIDFDFSSIGSGTHTPKLRSGRQTITLRNDGTTLRVVRIERMIPRDDVVTATMIATNPTFRRLFPGQCLADDNPVQTETMTFLATAINNIDTLYQSRGETEAYVAIQSHHEHLAAAVNGCGGTVVKTIGECMLAVFNCREDAVIASQRIRVSMRDHQGDSSYGASLDVLLLGIGIHSGPALVTTQNHQLDYFGATVRAVMSLPKQSDGDTLLTEPVYGDAAITERFPSLPIDVEIVRLAGTPQQRVKRIATS